MSSAGKREKEGEGVSYDCGQRFLYDIFSGARFFFCYIFFLHKSIGLDSIIGHLVY